MSTINYDNRVFSSVCAIGGGELRTSTLFVCRQRGDVVWATYAGGRVVHGTLLARVLSDGSLDARYQHLDCHGEFASGRSRSTPELTCDGRLRLREAWQWNGHDRATGTVVLEELAGEERAAV